ncbi:MAG: hypothetical protein NT090_19430 [Acidobacteria bacterium]|nr:hypothetical protein [Acidobacteriota bacterium]
MSNFFQSFGFGFSARSLASSCARLAMRAWMSRSAFVFDLQRVVAGGLVREGGRAERAPPAAAHSGLGGQPKVQTRLFAVFQQKCIVVAIGVIAEDDARGVLHQHRADLALEGVVGPLGVADDQRRVEVSRLFVDDVHLDVSLAVLVAARPGVVVDHGVGPGFERDAAVSQVVILMDRVGQFLHRRGEHPRRIAREVVPEQFAGGNAGHQNERENNQAYNG